MKVKDKILAKYWVLAYGFDCDGYNSGAVTSYASREDAENEAMSQSEWSDGLQYVLTDDWNDVEEYCYSYNKKSINYKSI